MIVKSWMAVLQLHEKPGAFGKAPGSGNKSGEASTMASRFKACNRPYSGCTVGRNRISLMSTLAGCDMAKETISAIVLAGTPI